jgi:monoamine oxidase
VANGRIPRALRELVQDRVGDADDRPITSDDVEAHLSRREAVPQGNLSRRDLLKLGGAVGAGLAVTASGIGPFSTRERAYAAGAPASGKGGARVAVVGAGLAGLTAAYRLAQVGVDVRLFEARDRVGGRCWTSRGWADGQLAEHGGELINSSDVHLNQLIAELDLGLEDLFKGEIFGGKHSAWLSYVDGKLVGWHHLVEGQQPIIKEVIRAAIEIGSLPPGTKRNGRGPHQLGATDTAYSYGTATPAAIQMDQLTMSEWLDRNVPGVIGSWLGTYLDEIMSSWYGVDLDGLSALNWIDYYLIPIKGVDERWRVRGGNDQVVWLTASRLPEDALRLETPLEALVARSDGRYELHFTGSAPYVADFVILAMPFTTLRRVDLSRAGLSGHMTGAIQSLGMGTDGKLLLQYDERFRSFHTPFGPWSGGLDHTGPNLQTWASSVDEPGKAGLLTIYVGGHSGAKTFKAKVVHGPGPARLVDDALGWVNEAVPGTARHFNGKSWVDWWTGDPWTRGSYAAFTPGQMTQYWHGTGKAEGNVHFAGEQSSTYSQGFLNGGVESGDRTALEVMRQLGIPVPRFLSKLPYSTFA